MYYKKDIGEKGEEIASRYLESIGYKIVDRNFLCYQGEIDIVAYYKKEFIFVEVKTRRNKKYGDAKDAVNNQKKRHFWNAVKYYIYINNLEKYFIRLDVIEIYLKKNKVYLNHIKQAIE